MKNKKITILLIDDDPSFTEHDGIVSLKYGCRREERSYIEDNFHLIWLKDIYEIKTYYDGIKFLNSTDSKSLYTSAIVPELIVFDYCLTRSISQQTNRLEDPTNPNTILYREIKKIRPNYKTLEDALKERPTRTISRSGKDRYGLVAGTFLCSFFYDYVTTGLPTTAYSDIAKSPDEAGFIEWLHEDLMRFAQSERKGLEWGQLLFESLIDIRDRFTELLTKGIITLDIYKLILTTDSLCNTELSYHLLYNAEITFSHSSYGDGSILLSSLFFDHFYDRDNQPSFNSHDHTEIVIRDTGLICDYLNELISLSLNGSMSKDEYSTFFGICMEYIKSYKNDQPRPSEPFLTKRGLSDDQKNRLFILAMVLWLDQAEQPSSRTHLRRQIQEVFFPNQSSDTKRRALKSAGINIDNILDGNIPEDHKKIIALHAGKVSHWPNWWII